MLIGYTPCAAGWNEVFKGGYDLAKQGIQQVIHPPMNTDLPTEIYLGDNPERQPDTRGAA